MLLKKHPGAVVATILLAFLIVSLLVASQESTTMDELSHIASGYSYVRFGDMRLNPEHPPLLKDLAGIPLLFFQPAFPLNQIIWTSGINEQWKIGDAFLHGLGNNADSITFWARTPIAFVAVLLGMFIYVWTRQLAGTLAGLFALTLYAFDPNVLGHDHLVTTDIGIAAFIFIAAYWFVRFLKTPSRKAIILFGVFLGLAQLAKFSAVILFPFFALLTIIFAFARTLHPDDYPATSPQAGEGGEKPLSPEGGGVGDNAADLAIEVGRNKPAPAGVSGKLTSPMPETVASRPYSGLRQNFNSTVLGVGERGLTRWMLVFNYIGKYAIAVMLCFMVIWIVYYFNTMNMPAEKITIISNDYFKGDKLVAHLAKAVVAWMAGVPLLKPLAHYFLGVFMVVERTSVGSNSYYFLGTVRNHGTPAYFPVAFLLKETLPFLFLLVASLAYSLSRLFVSLADKTRGFKEKYARYVEANIAQIAMMGFVIFYSYLCIKGNLNIGFRHLFPMLPFLYVLTAKITADALQWLREQTYANIRVINSIAGLVVFWIVSIPVLAYPSYLSYFNEMAGGHVNGYRYLADSNYDWGQDLKNLKKWVGDYNECVEKVKKPPFQACDLSYRPPTETPIESIRISYFGGSSPRYYFGNTFILWHHDYRPEPGWYAVSAEFFQERTHGPFEPDTWSYRWLEDYPMISRAGDSIFIFYVPDDSKLPVSPNAYSRDGEAGK